MKTLSRGNWPPTRLDAVRIRENIKLAAILLVNIGRLRGIHHREFRQLENAVENLLKIAERIESGLVCRETPKVLAHTPCNWITELAINRWVKEGKIPDGAIMSDPAVRKDWIDLDGDGKGQFSFNVEDCLRHYLE